MTDFRFLHAADIHLDSPLRGLSRYDGLPEDDIRGATRAAFDNLVQRAIDEAVNFVVIAGDLFDGDWKDMGTGLYFARAMGRLDQADIPVFLLSGNHDAESVLTRSVPWPPNVRVFGTRRPETHTLPELAVAVHGQSFATPAVTDNLERLTQWRQKLDESGLNLEIENAIATLDVLDELRAEIAAQTSLNARLDGMIRDADEHDSRVAAAADALGIPAAKETSERLSLMRSRLTAARSTATALDALQATVSSHYQEMASEEAKLTAALDSLEPLMKETGAADIDELACAIERSRAARALRAAIADTETAIKSAGDGKCLEELLDSLEGVDPDGLAARTQNLSSELADLNAEVDQAAAAHGDARRAFATLEQDGESAVDAASDADQARAELAVLSEQYILKRAEAVTLRWAIEQYRERHQDPMLLRASELFSTLTIGRYAALKIDNDAGAPRLLGIRDDGRTVVEIGAMSEGTTDQLFLALRLAAVEQSVASGIRLPFLADDLFVNFDDERSEAGFRVLAELAKSTQVLFFTHHPHLASIARSVVGTDVHSECRLP